MGTPEIVAIVSLGLGVLLGYVLAARAANAHKATLEQKAQGDAAALAGVRADLARVQEESARRAGFESLASEREKAIVQLKGEKDELSAELRAKTTEASQSAALVAELNSKLVNEQQNLAEKIALLEAAETKLCNHFQKLAQEILEQKSKTFAEGSQKEIGSLLNPLKDQIKDFREKVEAAQKDSNTGVAELRGMIGSLGTLNQALAEEARNLTTALRGSAKAQGDWGEFILRDLLEKAGLREGEQYTFQQGHTVESENGERGRAVRTDVIVSLPGNRSLVIDSKVSLTAYADWCAAQEDESRGRCLKAHLASVRGHMTGLSKAGYHRLPDVEAPDFVVLFVPIEPAFLLALQNDSDLWSDAYQQGILLVGPTTLLYVIRIVNILWQQERQARNVRDVMERGARLYEKFVGFVSDLEDLGKNIRSAGRSYDEAYKKLSDGPGNLVRQVEMLKDLGVRSTKSLPRALLDRADAEDGLLSLAAGAEPADKG